MSVVSIHEREPSVGRTPSVTSISQPFKGGHRRNSPVTSFFSRFHRSSISVVPARQNGPTRRLSNSNLMPPLRLTFWQAFGALGPPLLIVAIVCISWTSWLVFLTVAPNEAANLLMNTEDYDSGNFWLIVDRELAIKWTSVAGLLLVDVCYIGALYEMLTFRAISVTQKAKHWFHKVQTFYAELTGYSAKNRKFFNLGHKVSDMVVQGLVLRRALDQGLPGKIALGYSFFVCVNGLSAGFNIATSRNSAFVEVLIDSIFDLIAAVIHPIVVLGYCYNNFNFDRNIYLIYAEVLPEGSFERLARPQADPADVALFLLNFNSLRISGAMDFMLGIGLNLSFCYRFFRVVNVIRAQNYQVQVKQRRIIQTGHVIEVVRPWQRPIPRWAALPFVLASAFAVAFTYTAISHSQAACAAYPECVAFAHVWKMSENCPCITLIDGNRAPLTADAWNSPKDVTDEVRALAAAGLLQDLQLINRQLLHWPEELRRCTNLKTISLIYTSTEEIPSWANDFKHLELLHVEGKFGSRNLVSLPSDFFSDLPELTFLHLGNHHNLVAIPPFDGIPNLRSITLAVLLSLSELPSFEKIPHLEAFYFVHLPRVTTVPDLTPLTKLSRFAVYRPNHVCCNGFIGECNLDDDYCQFESVFNVPAATCLEPNSQLTATPATRHVFARFAAAICQKPAGPFALEAVSDFPTPDRIAACSGILYKQCEITGVTSINGIVGICYNSRMQVVACNAEPLYIKVRRLEIERGIGLPCDPNVESWLGCR